MADEIRTLNAFRLVNNDAENGIVEMGTYERNNIKYKLHTFTIKRKLLEMFKALNDLVISMEDFGPIIGTKNGDVVISSFDDFNTQEMDEETIL